MAIDGTLVMNPFLYSKLAYDPFKDFAPISVIALVPSAVVGNIKIPIDSIKELVDREKAKPGTFQIGISTPTSQVNVGLLNMMAGTNFTTIPYRGGTTQITGILAGDIALGMESINVSLPLWREKKVKILGLVNAQRLSLDPAWEQAPLESDAKGYPNRPIRIIVPFPPGGPADTITRIVGQRITEDWSQPVVIENRAGGNTAIGAQAAARAAADGYTLLAAMDTTMVINPLVAANLPYDPLKDFVPITLLTKTMSLVVVRSDGPNKVKELIAKAKGNPGKLNRGAGSITSRLGALQFARAAGIDVQLVPFKGSALIGSETERWSKVIKESGNVKLG